jgi:hypothetical protein
MDDNIISQIARKVGLEREHVDAVVSEFALQLHKHALEYRGQNGDFIGEDLWYQVGLEAYFHLLGFIEYFADRYSWDRGDSVEYLLRIALRDEWEPFRRQMEGWAVARRGPLT